MAKLVGYDYQSRKCEVTQAYLLIVERIRRKARHCFRRLELNVDSLEVEDLLDLQTYYHICKVEIFIHTFLGAVAPLGLAMSRSLSVDTFKI